MLNKKSMTKDLAVHISNIKKDEIWQFAATSVKLKSIILNKTIKW